MEDEDTNLLVGNMATAIESKDPLIMDDGMESSMISADEFHLNDVIPTDGIKCEAVSVFNYSDMTQTQALSIGHVQINTNDDSFQNEEDGLQDDPFGELVDEDGSFDEVTLTNTDPTTSTHLTLDEIFDSDIQIGDIKCEPVSLYRNIFSDFNQISP